MNNSALYVVSSTNLETVETVAEEIKRIASIQFSKIYIISTNNSHLRILEQMEIYEKHFSPQRIEEIIIDINNGGDKNIIVDIFKESSQHFVDLSNGPRIVSAILYMCANLCNINDVYYLSKNSNDQSEYVKVKKFIDNNSFADYSFYDIIYYNEEISSIFGNEDYSQGSLMWKVQNELYSAVNTFFVKGEFKTAIFSAVCGIEYITDVLLNFLIDTQAEVTSELNVDFKNPKYKDPIGKINYFFSQYSQQDKYSDLNKIQCLPFLLSSLRGFRNSAAHYAKHTHVFSNSEARIVINTSIELYRILRQNDEIWKRLINTQYMDEEISNENK